jgi:hypothetical protein
MQPSLCTNKPAAVTLLPEMDTTASIDHVLRKNFPVDVMLAGESNVRRIVESAGENLPAYAEAPGDVRTEITATLQILNVAAHLTLALINAYLQIKRRGELTPSGQDVIDHADKSVLKQCSQLVSQWLQIAEDVIKLGNPD